MRRPNKAMALGRFVMPLTAGQSPLGGSPVAPRQEARMCEWRLPWIQSDSTDRGFPRIALPVAERQGYLFRSACSTEFRWKNHQWKTASIDQYRDSASERRRRKWSEGRWIDKLRPILGRLAGVSPLGGNSVANIGVRGFETALGWQRSVEEGVRMSGSLRFLSSIQASDLTCTCFSLPRTLSRGVESF